MYVQSRTENLIFTELQISLIQNVIFMIQQSGMYLLMNSNSPVRCWHSLSAIGNDHQETAHLQSCTGHQWACTVHQRAESTEWESSFSCPFVKKRAFANSFFEYDG